MQLKKILIERDNLTSTEAESLICDAVDDLISMINNGSYIDDAKFMAEWFNLEPDLFIELLPV